MIHQLSRENFRRGGPVLLLLVVTAAVYSNSLHNAYQLDDAYRIVGNTELERVWPPWRHFLDPRTATTLASLTQYRPLLPLALSVNILISDSLGLPRLVGLHSGNIAIHLLTTALLLSLFKRLLTLFEPGSGMASDRRGLVAFFAAGCWAVHPVSGIPVNYLSARDLLLMQLFLVAALLAWAHMRGRRESALGWLGIVALATLSLMSKETGIVVMPLVLLLEMLLPRDRPSRGRWLWWLGGAALTVAVYLEVGGQRLLDRLTPSPSYGLVQLKVHLLYLRNVFWPFEARMLAEAEPPHLPLDLALFLGLGVVVGSLYLAWRWRNRWPLFTFCILAYWVVLAPSSSFLRLMEAANDYRPYAAMAFLLLLLSTGLFTSVRGRLPVVIASAGMLYLGITSFSMNGIYSTQKSMYSHIVRHGGTASAHLNLARHLTDPARAEHHYREALAREPTNIYALINLGFLQVGHGQVAEGVAAVERAAELRPTWGFSHYWLSKVYAEVERMEEAVEAGRRAVELESRNASYLYQLVLALQRQGDFEASLPYVQRLQNLSPGYERSTFHEALALQMLDRWDEAAERYAAFLVYQPEDANAHYNLAFKRMEQGDYAGAIQGFTSATREGGALAGAAHRWLSRCYRETGNLDAAKRHAALGAAGPPAPWTPDAASRNR